MINKKNHFFCLSFDLFYLCIRINVDRFELLATTGKNAKTI